MTSLDILPYIFGCLITIINIAYISYVMRKMSYDTIRNRIKSDMEQWLNSENGQKALYSIGALLASGMQSGLGLKSSSGKFKWQDLIMQIAGQYIGKVLPQPAQPQQQPF